MANLNRYFFNKEGMRLDVAQGDNQRGEYVKFSDHVEALRSASDNSQSVAALKDLNKWIEDTACYLPDSELDRLRPIIQCLNSGVPKLHT